MSEGGTKVYAAQVKAHLSDEVCLIAAQLPGYRAPVEVPFESTRIPPDLRHVGARFGMRWPEWSVERLQGAD
jgi:hypothetical protein